MNIGEKLLEMPKIGFDCRNIYEYFGFTEITTLSKGYFPNARRLVELNNEVYEKLKDYESYKALANLNGKSAIEKLSEINKILDGI